jgi:hypothetical protein
MSCFINPYRFATGGPTDAHFSTTKLLLGFNGANGSTTFTDESAAARGGGTPAGDAQVSTASPKFGTGALLLDGVGDALGFTDSADWRFTGDFTIEGWFYFDSGFIGVSTQVLMSQWDGGANNRSWILQLTSGGLLQFAISANLASSTILHSVSWTPTASTWYHVAVDRSGNTWRLYRDGSMLATASSASTPADSNPSLRIGASGNSGTNVQFLKGQVDEVRVNNGHAYYASNAGYTVPIAPFPRS